MRSMKSTFLVVSLSFAFAACGGGSKPAKGGGARGAAAKGSGQTSGGTATGDKGQGTQKGETYEGVTCDSSTDGLAWCDSDTDVVFCSGGVWYLLDCSSPEIGGDVCGETDDTIDCYAADEF